MFQYLRVFWRTHTIRFNNDFLASKKFIKKSHVNRYPSQSIYDTNLFYINFNHFEMFLTNFNSSFEFLICSKIPSSEGSYHIETSLLICNTNLWTGFYVVGGFPGSYSQTNCNFNFNINVDVTADSYMNRWNSICSYTY